MTIFNREDDEKCMTFGFRSNVISRQGSASAISNYQDFNYNIVIYRINTIGANTTLSKNLWPGQIIGIENKLSNDVIFKWTTISYPDKVATRSNILDSGTETIWANWWSLWVVGNKGIHIMCASA